VPIESMTIAATKRPCRAIEERTAKSGMGTTPKV
jgi:hypothetical protein